MRKLSDEVENLLRESLVDEEVRQALKRINADIKTPKVSRRDKAGKTYAERTSR